ncbi:MAG TPA: hypothetical protein VGH67_06195 [Solirubrobacteraceae bacterium]
MRATTAWMAILLSAMAILLSGASIAGCGSGASSTPTAGAGASSSTSTTHLAKTKFVLHAGLAFGAFHRYIYKPFKEGKFSAGLLHHKLATLKAGLAAVFAYHEVKLALQDARSSKLLSKALSPLLALQTKLGALATGLKHGSVDGTAITSANADADQTSQAGAGAGQPITDQATPSLGG